MPCGIRRPIFLTPLTANGAHINICDVYFASFGLDLSYPHPLWVPELIQSTKFIRQTAVCKPEEGYRICVAWTLEFSNPCATYFTLHELIVRINPECDEGIDLQAIMQLPPWSSTSISFLMKLRRPPPVGDIDLSPCCFLPSYPLPSSLPPTLPLFSNLMYFFNIIASYSSSGYSLAKPPANVNAHPCNECLFLCSTNMNASPCCNIYFSPLQSPNLTVLWRLISLR